MRLAGPEGMLFVGFNNNDLHKYVDSTLAEVAIERGTSPEETAIDLILEDERGIEVVYFLMSEHNVRRQVALPWVTFGSDAASISAEGALLERQVHPRTYGNFARVLGKYVREEQLLSLETAIHKLTALPAENLSLQGRGRLQRCYFADIVVFDPRTIQDHATYSDPHQYATGVRHVFVNGLQVLEDGEHTGATPGRVVRGPGWTGWDDTSAPQAGTCP
jgi:N-acyl-D-amino-acid deacylase